MAFSVRIRISTGFGASLLLICAVGLLSYWALTELIEANQWVEHTYQVLGALDDFQDSLVAAENAAMAFAVSGQARDAELFRGTSESARQQFSRLRDLTADNSNQQRRLGRLDPLISQRLALLEERVEHWTTSSPDAARDSTLAGEEGEQAANTIRSTIARMKAEETRLLTERNRTTRADAHRTIAIIVASSVAAFLLVLFATISVNRNMAHRMRAEERAQRHSRRREMLRSIDLAVLSADSLDRIAKTMLEGIRDLLPYQRASVIVFDDPEHGEGRVLAARGDEGSRPEVGSRVLPEFFGDPEALRAGRAYVKADGAADVDVSYPHWAGPYLSVPLLVEKRLVGVFKLGNDRPETFTAEYQETARELATSLAVAFQRGLLFEHLQSAHSRLETLSRRLLEAEETERGRLARDLHDELGQLLTAISYRLQSLGKKVGGTPLESPVAESIEVLQTAMQQVRNLALNLRPASLDDQGLVRTLEWFIERQARGTELSTRFTADPPEISLPPELETTCFRVVQEALTNAMRYARASRLDVSLRQVNGEVELLIQDDGVGFDVEAARQKAQAGSGFGLMGMGERVRLAGGHLDIESAPGAGTIIRAHFPKPR
ncbi:MAG: CHASE3 domain-containing protein [Acidobacteriota bacterium]